MTPRIRQIQIQGFKSIDRVVVDLEPFTVLVGLNGVGKSNFLDALAFVRDCLSMPIELAHGKRGSISPAWDRKRSCGIRLLIDLSHDLTADYSFEIAEQKVARERCMLRSRGGQETQFEVLDGNFLHEIPGIRPQLEPNRLALFAASATEEFRPLYDFLASMRAYAIDPAAMFGPLVDSGESLKENGENAAAVLKTLQEQTPEGHARIESLLGRAVEGIQRIQTHVYKEILFLDFQKDIGSDQPAHLSSFDMSDGTLRILGLLLAVYQLKRPTVLAFEEPEATIHPGAAEMVTQVLMDAAQDRQVLITTHSPDVLDSKDLKDDQIRVVTMEQGRTIIAPLAQSTRQAIREHLYTPGELLRIGELWQDVEAAKAASERLDLFPEPASTPS